MGSVPIHKVTQYERIDIHADLINFEVFSSEKLNVIFISLLICEIIWEDLNSNVIQSISMLIIFNFFFYLIDSPVDHLTFP